MPLPEITVEVARDRRVLREFILLPWRIYRQDAHWVPPLLVDMEKLLDRRKHPFHQHAEVEYFVARRAATARSNGVTDSEQGGPAGEVIGRIAAIVNHEHNRVHEERTGFFGFFETIDDDRVTAALLDAAALWLRERGMERMRGPANFSSNEEWGMLIDGFDSSPMVMMTYNPRYYPEHLDRCGLIKAKDVVAYSLGVANLPERLMATLRRIHLQSQVTVRKLNMKRFDAEVGIVRTLYNQAWERNWGFVPMTEAEIDHMARELKPVVDPDLVLFAELEGKPIGFALALPDAYQALKKANGRLLPFGLIRILLESKRIRHLRVLTLGVLPQYRNLGADALLYLGLCDSASAKGYVGSELSWILEDNLLMRRAIERFGARVYKTYRLYDRPLAER